MPNTIRELRVTQASISKRLKEAELIQSQGNGQLSPRDVVRRFCMADMLFERYKESSFLHPNEKWIHYNNLKRKKSYVKADEPAKSTTKSNSHDAKVMLYIR